MKRIIAYLSVLLTVFFMGCSNPQPAAKVAATTLPVYEFTAMLCQGTDITVTRLVTENVSCLHDYSLSIRQVKAAEGAEVIVASGAGLEEFMADILATCDVIDSSAGISLMCGDHQHEAEEHTHEYDPHIWLSPENAKGMAGNIARELAARYPQYSEKIAENLGQLLEKLDALQSYGEEQLGSLSCKKLITFHDGFAYFAESFGLTVLKAVEEESGSEASAGELIELSKLVTDHSLPAIFTETNGSTSAAQIVAAQTGAKVYTLDMAMSGESYFTAMYQNIDTIKEALG